MEPYTFKEKQEFDPARLAHDIREKNLGVQDQDAMVRSIWKSNRACQLCYRDDISSFFADIYDELKPRGIPEPLGPIPGPTPPPKLRRWPEGEEGYRRGRSGMQSSPSLGTFRTESPRSATFSTRIAL